MDHRSPQIYRNLGKLYEETDKTAEAYRVFRAGKAQYPENEGLVFDELDFYLKNANPAEALRSDEHTSELQSLMRISYDLFSLKKKHIHKHKYQSNSTV